jgi:hypothetical protein
MRREAKESKNQPEGHPAGFSGNTKESNEQKFFRSGVALYSTAGGHKTRHRFTF